MTNKNKDTLKIQCTKRCSTISQKIQNTHQNTIGKIINFFFLVVIILYLIVIMPIHFIAFFLLQQLVVSLLLSILQVFYSNKSTNFNNKTHFRVHPIRNLLYTIRIAYCTILITMRPSLLNFPTFLSFIFSFSTNCLLPFYLPSSNSSSLFSSTSLIPLIAIS